MTRRPDVGTSATCALLRCTFQPRPAAFWRSCWITFAPKMLHTIRLQQSSSRMRENLNSRNMSDTCILCNIVLIFSSVCFFLRRRRKNSTPPSRRSMHARNSVDISLVQWAQMYIKAPGATLPLVIRSVSAICRKSSV